MLAQKIALENDEQEALTAGPSMPKPLRSSGARITPTSAVQKCTYPFGRAAGISRD